MCTLVLIGKHCFALLSLYGPLFAILLSDLARLRGDNADSCGCLALLPDHPQFRERYTFRKALEVLPNIGQKNQRHTCDTSNYRIQPTNIVKRAPGSFNDR